MGDAEDWEDCEAENCNDVEEWKPWDAEGDDSAEESDGVGRDELGEGDEEADLEGSGAADWGKSGKIRQQLKRSGCSKVVTHVHITFPVKMKSEYNVARVNMLLSMAMMRTNLANSLLVHARSR